MKLKEIKLKDFKRFTDLEVSNIPKTVKLVILTGPNGSGKTSLFEAFNTWMNYSKGFFSYIPEYYEKKAAKTNYYQVENNIKIEFHDKKNTDVDDKRKYFYIRSAYRHESSFTLQGLRSSDEILINALQPQQLIHSEQRVSDNYTRLVSSTIDALFNNPETRKKTGEEITDELIGEVSLAMKKVFDNLHLEGPGNPMTSGTFRFTKGISTGVHYQNLSGGEKAAFDLLLDFIVKREAFNNTIYCIDEPELHMHTRLQARLLEVMFDLIPDNCQLWLSTHSIGMARKAAELNSANPENVAFIDFHNQDFDKPVRLQPIHPDRTFWQQMFETALDDLSKLVVPKYVVFCEGKRIGSEGEKASFDATVYQKIFGENYPDIEFVSLGGSNEVENDGQTFNYLLTKLAPGIKTWKVFDKDDRNQNEIEELLRDEIYVLSRRDIESFLWDDEVLAKFCNENHKPEAIPVVLKEKLNFLNSLPSRGKPKDDVKAITNQLYNSLKRILNMPGLGNTAEPFALEHLVPLIQPGMKVYEELAGTVVAPLLAKDL